MDLRDYAGTPVAVDRYLAQVPRRLLEEDAFQSKPRDLPQLSRLVIHTQYAFTFIVECRCDLEHLDPFVIQDHDGVLGQREEYGLVNLWMF